MFCWARWDLIGEIRAQLPAFVRRPPLLAAPVDGSWLLCENLQITGSYKVRAAFAVLQAYLRRGTRGPGLVLSSSGNFAIAFAYAGRVLGVPISVVMMRKSSSLKADRAASYGARIVLCGDHLEERLATMSRLRDEEGWWMLDHLEDPQVIAAHATLGYDLCQAWSQSQLPESGPRQVLVPVSTGGLACGIALAVKQRFPQCRVVGVQSDGSDAAARSFRAREIVSRDCVETECDALTANRPGRLPLEVALEWLDDIITVDEDSIRAAVLDLLEHAHLLVEPGGAVGFAALQTGRAGRVEGSVAVLSGGNFDLKRLWTWGRAS